MVSIPTWSTKISCIINQKVPQQVEVPRKAACLKKSL